jgi:15-cis-phytoene synthase
VSAVATDDPLKRGTPPGSMRHFAVTYAPRNARPVLDALYAFEAELRDTVQSSTHEVAHTRLQWWRGEVDRLIAGRAEHPVTQALSPLRDVAGGELPLLHEALVAADIDLSRLTFNSRASIEAYCFRSAGSLQTLAAAACAGARPLSATEREFARRLGSALCRTEILRDLRAHTSAGRLPLALDDLDAANIDPRTVLAGEMTEPFAQLIDAQRRALHEELLALPGVLEPAERRVQTHGRVLAALLQRLLDHIEHPGELARTRAQLKPWAKLWTAWRTALKQS